MKVIEASYRIVTPMFIGGANQDPSDGIRPPSFKGALRFWWRALNWGKFYQESQGNEANALKALHRKESNLFGSAVKDGKGGQGCFLLKIIDKTSSKGSFEPKAAHQYLLGQGLYHFKQGLLRQPIHSGEFDVVLRFRKNDEDKMDSIKEALVFLGCLGGMGSRARKGLGALSIVSLKVNEDEQALPQNTDELQQVFQTAMNGHEGLPPYSAFSAHSRIDISQTGNKALELLNIAGNELQLYRGYGRKQGGKHKVNGVDAEQNFANDHDLMLDFIEAGDVSKHPDRAVFGLPHNYFFSSIKKGVDVEASGKARSRRASPLILHVHEFPNHQFALIQTFLPAVFLPEGDKVKLKYKRDRYNVVTQQVTPQENWDVVYGFMDRFPNRISVFGGVA